MRRYATLGSTGMKISDISFVSLGALEPASCASACSFGLPIAELTASTHRLLST